jgi:hypothetical protein
MNTELAPAHREAILATVFLFPFRIVERTRRGRRLALLLLYGLIALAIWAILWRQSQVARLPDVGETFGSAVIPNAGRVSDDRNAFILYRQATQRFRELKDAEAKSFEKADLKWSRADATLRGWLAENDPAVSLMCGGASRPDAYVETIESAPDPLAAQASLENFEVIQRLFWIGDAALFKAGQRLSERDPSGAWTLFRAVLRVSRDMERALPTTGSRQTAMTLVQYARQPVADWAKDPAVSAALLRQALDDLATLEALTPPISLFYRHEYQTADESFMRLSLSSVLADQRRSGIVPHGHFERLPGLEVYLRGEPERSRRVLRLLAANDLAWCDRPVFERPAFAIPRLRIYAHNPAAPATARALSPQELARWTHSTLIGPALKWRLGDLEQWERSDRWSLNELKVAVAVSLFTREMGRPPATPAEALRRYLPMPGDTPERDEAEPLPSPEQSGKQSSR